MAIKSPLIDSSPLILLLDLFSFYNHTDFHVISFLLYSNFCSFCAFARTLILDYTTYQHNLHIQNHFVWANVAFMIYVLDSTFFYISYTNAGRITFRTVS